MLFRLLAPLFNALPVSWQRRILERAHPRFLVGVTGVGVDPSGDVLLARHRFGSPEWRLLGGFIEREEPLEAALARELREETGLEVEVGPLLEAGAGVRWAHVELVYAYRPVGGRIALSGELSELRSFPPDRLPPLRPDQRNVVERHFSRAREWARVRASVVDRGK